MARDDKEKTNTEPKAPREGRLPPQVEQALARAREAAKADRASKGGRWLALLPVGVAVVMLLLMMPRGAPPDGIPLPRVDTRTLSALARADDARAAAAEAERLPTDVLAVGSALRVLKGAEARGEDSTVMIDAKRKLERSLLELPQRDKLEDNLLSLRALQTRRFLDALAHWEKTGEKTTDLDELAGSLVARAEEAGWATTQGTRSLLLSEPQRRVAFKTVWNSLLGLDSRPAFALTLDEQRSIHAFYLEHPHPSDSRRLSLVAQRQSATTPEACARANVEEQRQAELWRAEKIKKIGSLDPTYPTAYALGVSYYRAGRFDLSADAFTAFLGTHPDGAYAGRAKNHLKAALAAGGAI